MTGVDHMRAKRASLAALAACFLSSVSAASTTADYTARVELLDGHKVLFSGDCPAHFGLDGVSPTVAITELDCDGIGKLTVVLSLTGDGKHTVSTADGTDNNAWVMWRDGRATRVSFGKGRSLIFSAPKEGES